MSFPAKTPGETKILSFDFSREAAVGSVLTYYGISASAVISGPGVVDDIQVGTVAVDGFVVSAPVGGGIDGTKYRISCTVDADNGETHQIDKDLPVKDNAAVVR